MHAVAMSRVLLVTAVAAPVVLATWGFIRHGRNARGRLFSISAVVAAVVLAMPLFVPAVGGEESVTAAKTPRGGITVLTWNTGQDDVPAATIQSLALDSEADVVVLPEYFDTVAAAQLVDWAESNGFQVLSQEASTSSVLISERLGSYSANMDGVPPWAGFVATPSDPGSPKIVVAHVEHARLWSASLWNEHLDWISSECSDRNVIAVGDFNATRENLDAGTLGACTDSASALGKAQAGTSPVTLPVLLGAQIHRVMTGSGWHASDFSVLTSYDGAGSDHRPVLARVTKGAP